LIQLYKREPADMTFATLEHGRLDCLPPPITSWENSFLRVFFPYNLAHGRPQAGAREPRPLPTGLMV